jgi:3D (Asp-Asp-Asp) domain-containing protein
LSILSRCLLAASVATVPAAGRAECVTRPMRITFYTCAEGSRHCLTKQGNQPMPLRTVAVGDPRLLGRWLYIEDLGGWVLASDSGAALQPNSVDVFIGDARMARHARRLGVQHWDVRWCDPVATRLRSSSAARSAAPRRTEASRSDGTRSPGRRSTQRPASRRGSAQP